MKKPVTVIYKSGIGTRTWYKIVVGTHYANYTNVVAGIIVVGVVITILN